LGRVDEIIGRIARSRPGLTLEKVREMVEDKKRRYHGLLTDEGAAHLVAQDLGVDLGYSGGDRVVSLSSLVPGLRDVSVEASIVYIGQPREFKRRSGTGKVLRLILDDGSRQMSCVLWDDRVDEFLALNPQVGWRVKVLHGYTRAGAGGVELHVGARGFIKVVETEGGRAAPTKKISELTVHDRVFIVEAAVLSKGALKSFSTRAGEGKVLRIKVRDDTGILTLVLWNEAAEKMAEVEEGSMVKILGGKVRVRPLGDLEVHINEPDMVELLPSKVELRNMVFKVEELKPDMKGLILLLRVYSKPFTRSFKTPHGGEGKVSSVLVGDETGLIVLNMWGEASLQGERLKNGDVILLKNAYTRLGLRGLELHIGSEGIIEVNPEVSPPELLNLKRNVEELKEGDTYVTVEGIVLTNPETRIVNIPSGEVKVSSFILGDETGSIRVSAWRNLAEEVEKIEAGAVVRITHLYVKQGLTGSLEASTTRFSELTVLETAE